MEVPFFGSSTELKHEIDTAVAICRCCLTTERRMKSVSDYASYFVDLAGLNVLESDGLPQWLCYECCTLLEKAVHFKQKLLRAHNVLYEYLTRCAPFPIDAQDPELAKYASPHLCATSTLAFDSGKSKLGYHKALQHKKLILKTELDAVQIPVNKEENDLKEETGLSDYEDNITLEEYRLNAPKSPEIDIKDNEISELFWGNDSMLLEETKKKPKKSKEEKSRKKKLSEPPPSEEPLEPKTSIRKQIYLDPTKIRVVTLNPEEQVKQREEESKANLKFPFQCTLCFKGFNFDAKLQNHMSKHSPSRGEFECKLCRMYLPTSYSYSVHSLIHTRRYECLRCGRRMIDRASIVDHYKTQHEGVLTLFTCHLCGKVSSNSKTHRGHMRNHHGGARPECDQCGKTFVNKDSLAEHLQIHQGIKNYSCGTCGKRFRTRTQIKHHQLKHSDVKEFYCVECDVRFKSAHSLRQHLQKSLKHKDIQSLKYACSRCEKRFDTTSRLQHHVRVQHEGVRAHRCAQCPAALATRNSLNKHVHTVHTGHKPPPRHVCDTCGKAFRGKSVLTNHVRTHTGEKPFPCGECGRSFTQRTAMRTHVNLVHLKLRRQPKIKPEVPLEERDAPKPDMFPKEEATLVFDTWNRQPMTSCEVYFGSGL